MHFISNRYIYATYGYWYSYSYVNVIKGQNMDSKVMHVHIQ